MDKFGYPDYNDAYHNGIRLTIDEIKNLKDGDEAIVLITNDKDDDYSLDNRLFKGTVRVLCDQNNIPDAVDVDGFVFDFNDQYLNIESDSCFLLHPKVKPLIIGNYSTKDKFIEFVGGSSNINFLSKEAYIEGGQLSGLDFDGIKFKLTICDEGTVNFDEVDTNLTTSEQRGRLIELISEKTLIPYRKRWCVQELKFTSVNKVGSKYIPLFLSVEYQRPIDKLASIFSNEIEVSENTGSKIDTLMSLFGESNDEVDIQNNDDEVEIIEEQVSSYQSTLEESFKKMKQDKVDEIKSRIKQKEKDISKFESDVILSTKKVDDAKSELKLLTDRLDTLQPKDEFNGYYFNVSERINEKVELDDDTYNLIFSKVKKIKGINANAFMKFFENGEYQIRIGVMDNDKVVEITDYDSLSDDMKNKFSECKMYLDTEVIDGKEVKKIKYVGDMTWGQINQRLVKSGFGQDSQFDKDCNSNSFVSHMEDKVSSDTNLVWDESNDELDDTYDDLKNENEFIFAVYTDDEDSQVNFCVNPLSYGKNITYDQHMDSFLCEKFPGIKSLSSQGKLLEEDCENSLSIIDIDHDRYLTIEETVKILCENNIKPCITFQKHNSSKDLDLLINTVKNLGYEHLLIS